MVNRGVKWLLLLPIAAVIVVADQLSKNWVLNNLTMYEKWAPIPSISKWFWFLPLTNTGSAFGLFQNGSTVLLAIGVVVVIAIIAYTKFLPIEHWLVLVSLGLQLGGAMGNLTDRFRHGHVIDFIDVPYWPTFNVADSSIVVGAILLGIFVLTWREEAEEPQETPGLQTTIEG